MNRTLLQRHIEQAQDDHVVAGRQRIARQTEIVARMSRDGRVADSARALLNTFVEVQQTQEADLGRLKKKLGDLD